MRTLHFGITIALSAFLLFLVQPIIAKAILPWFGGSAAVWTTCMVFFQVVLVLGYAYADRVARLAPRRQALIHAGVVLASLAFLPILPSAGLEPEDGSAPIGHILVLLVATLGLPYFALSTTGPLVQAWFVARAGAARDAVAANDGGVYRLYALSNAGSLLALIAYPTLVEPQLGHEAQAISWSVGYGAFAALVLALAWRFSRVGSALGAAPTGAGVTALATEAAPAPRLREHLVWLGLGALGTALLLGVTAHITQNVAPIPFLWIVPLGLYLLTFIIAFEAPRLYVRPLFLALTGLLAPLMLAALSFRFKDGHIERGVLHIDAALPLFALGLFAGCLVCHGELARRKPAPAHLTRFYLMLSLGGAVGGLFVGVVAPLCFDWTWELPIALVALALIASIVSANPLRWLAAVYAVATMVLAGDYVAWVHNDATVIVRDFYGALRVKAYGAPGDSDATHRLVHGTITHGEQYLHDPRRMQPTTYYGPSSGLGRAIFGTRRDPAASQTVGLIGLGVGTTLAYARTGDRYVVYELNPAVVDIARTDFSYLTDAAADVEVVLGDARLQLEREPARGFDVLAIDAFSSDAIPIHLLTREAMVTWKRHMAPGGIIAFHISNRYLDLGPVVAALADADGDTAIFVDDNPSDESGLYSSDWMLIGSRKLAWLEALLTRASVSRVTPPPTFRAWTDDFDNLFEVLK